MSSFVIAQQLNNISETYMLCAGIFNLIFGIPGNIFIILILTTLRTFKQNQSAFYLTVESISNIGLLLSAYVSRILIYILGYDPVVVFLFWCKMRTMLTQVFAICSLFSICALAFDQYLSTNLQHNCRQMSTFKLAQRLTIFNICFSLFHSTTFFIFTENRTSQGCTVYNPTMKYYYSFVYYPIIVSVLPIVITVTSSLLAYRNVRRLVRRQMPITRRRLDRQMTAMTLARVIVSIVCGIPFICISLYQFNISDSADNYMQLAIANLLSSIFYSLEYTNAAISFYVFLIVSARFRRQAKTVLVKRCCRSCKCECDKRSTHARRNQVTPQTNHLSTSANKLE